MNLVNPVGLSLQHHKPGVAPVTPPRTATPQAADEHIRVVAPLQVQLPNPYAVPILPSAPVPRPAIDRMVVGATGAGAAKG